MNSNQVILIIVIIPILFLFNNILNIFGQQTFFASTLDSELTTYENSEKGISILYPSNWLPMENEFGIAFFPLSFDNQPPGVSILIRPSASITVEELVNNVIKDVSQQVLKFKLIEKNPFSLGGVNAYNILFTHFDSTTQTEIQTLQAFTIKNGKDYGITYQASAQDYSTYLPIIKQMIHSFRFIDSSVGTIQ
jgi:hypothetical protein